MADAVNSTRAWIVYTLNDPETQAVRYVGWTVNKRTRFRDHIKPSQLVKATHRDRWIASLIDRGLKPVMVEVDAGVGRAWADAERRWIAHYRTAGADLTNHTDGGEGTPGRYHTDKAKAAMSAKRKGVKPHPNAIAATVALATGRKDSPEKIQARMAAVRGVPKSPEHRKKLAAALRGRKATLESRANQSSAQKGLKHGSMSDEQKAKISAAKRGRPNEAKRLWWASKTPDERSEISRQRTLKRSAEDLREAGQRLSKSQTSEMLSARAKRRWASMTEDQKFERQQRVGKKAWSTISPEERSKIMRERWEIRRSNTKCAKE